MISTLYIIGAIVIIGSIVAGFMSGSFIGFLLSVSGGIVSAIIFFALAKILYNQDSILYRLEYQEYAERKARNQKKKTCPKCNYPYDDDYSSCPRCGYRS